MAVIALTSGMGTGVKYVAEKVARHLNLELVYREVCPAGHDFPSSATHSSGALGRWEAGVAWLKASRCLEGLANLEEICRLAQRGNVLICGTTPLHFLSAVVPVTKIRVRMTMALRVRRIMACMGTDESNAALEKILQSDGKQSEILKRLFGIHDFEQANLYDAVIDTGLEPADQCAQQIVNLASENAQRHPLGARPALDAMIEYIQAMRAHLSRQPVRASQ